MLNIVKLFSNNRNVRLKFGLNMANIFESIKCITRADINYNIACSTWPKFQFLITHFYGSEANTTPSMYTCWIFIVKSHFLVVFCIVSYIFFMLLSAVYKNESFALTQMIMIFSKRWSQFEKVFRYTISLSYAPYHSYIIRLKCVFTM